MENGKLKTEIEKIALELCNRLSRKHELEQQLKNEEKEINSLKMETLPELLANEGIAIGSKIVLTNGMIMSMKDFFSANIPCETAINKEKDPDKRAEKRQKRNDCMDWLNANGLDGIIKNEVVAKFGKGDTECVKELCAFLEAENFDYTKESNVNAMTLKATLKGVVADGEKVPFDLFSVVTGATVDIKAPK